MANEILKDKILTLACQHEGGIQTTLIPRNISPTIRGLLFQQLLDELVAEGLVIKMGRQGVFVMATTFGIEIQSFGGYVKWLENQKIKKSKQTEREIRDDEIKEKQLADLIFKVNKMNEEQIKFWGRNKLVITISIISLVVSIIGVLKSFGVFAK